MPRTEFTMHAGTHTIGGVIAEVRYGDHRVIFEMGSAYNPSTDIHFNGIERRTTSWLRDGLRLGDIPKIDGLYPAAAIRGVDDIISADDSDVKTIVFITHLHLDHMGYMGAVAPQIPVYLSANAQRIEAALQDTGDGVPTFRTEYTEFTPGEPIRFGEIELLPLLSYDMAYGHSSCFITTPDGTFHWTGDLVMHREEELPNRLAEIELLKGRVDVLICDCCEFMHQDLVDEFTGPDGQLIPTLDFPKSWTSFEDQAEHRRTMLAGISGLAVFNHYQREMEMVRLLSDLAAENGRTIVLEPDAAWIVHRYYGTKPHIIVPDTDRYAHPEHMPWFTELLANSTVVTTDEISANPSGYLVQVSYENLLTLLDLPSDGSAYVHLFGIPIGDFDPKYRFMRQVVDQAGFDFIDFGAALPAGHSSPGAVRYYAESIAPKVLIPAHSFNPERLEAVPGSVRLMPETGRTYVLRDGALIPADEIDA